MVMAGNASENVACYQLFAYIRQDSVINTEAAE